MSVLSVLQIQGTIHALRTQKTEDDVLEWDTESRQFENKCIIPLYPPESAALGRVWWNNTRILTVYR